MKTTTIILQMYLKKQVFSQNPMTFGLGIAIADINKDGWQDIYVTNDYNEPDYLYINNGNGTFADQSQQRCGICHSFPWELILLILITMACRIL